MPVIYGQEQVLEGEHVLEEEQFLKDDLGQVCVCRTRSRSWRRNMSWRNRSWRRNSSSRMTWDRSVCAGPGAGPGGGTSVFQRKEVFYTSFPGSPQCKEVLKFVSMFQSSHFVRSVSPNCEVATTYVYSDGG